MKLFALTFTMLWGSMMYAQISHDFSIYSEDGEKFTFYANGQQFNVEPQSRIEINNTNHDYFRDVRIVFEDSSIETIHKKFIQIGNVTQSEDHIPVVCLYRIVNKKGTYKVKFGGRSNKKIQGGNNVIIIND